MNKYFEQVIALDSAINAAYDAGDESMADSLYEQQEAVMDTIEVLGLRSEFDAFIKSMS